MFPTLLWLYCTWKIDQVICIYYPVLHFLLLLQLFKHVRAYNILYSSAYNISDQLHQLIIISHELSFFFIPSPISILVTTFWQFPYKIQTRCQIKKNFNKILMYCLFWNFLNFRGTISILEVKTWRKM